MLVRLFIEHPQALLFVDDGIPENILTLVFPRYLAQNWSILLISLQADYSGFDDCLFVVSLLLDLHRFIIVLMENFSGSESHGQLECSPDVGFAELRLVRFHDFLEQTFHAAAVDDVVVHLIIRSLLLRRISNYAHANKFVEWPQYIPKEQLLDGLIVSHRDEAYLLTESQDLILGVDFL